MSDPKAVERRRSALYRMAGKIAGGLAVSDDDDRSLAEIAESSVNLAEEIMDLVDKRNPITPRERPAPVRMPW